MTTAFTLLFRPEDLKRLLDQNPDKIVITCGLESETTLSGDKVGAFKVKARSFFKEARPEVSGVLNFYVPGCPQPPCNAGDEIFFPEDENQLHVSGMLEN
ncbi:MAG TPA: hypothetical protein VGQ59_04025 [Cyclobacteriaceae bacterium]|jgi:hypothetical protein|nr:hypothetical protein [Cyclobacteriaceae bacterium]